MDRSTTNNPITNNPITHKCSAHLLRKFLPLNARTFRAALSNVSLLNTIFLNAIFLGAIFPSTIFLVAIAPTQAAIASPQLQKAHSGRLRGRVPGRRRGGARRSGSACGSAQTDAQTSLAAIISESEVETDTLPETYVGGTTVAERPTLWFYVPYALNEDDGISAEFVLQNREGQLVYQTTSAELSFAGQTPGIVSVSLPAGQSLLSLEETYEWYFKVLCGSDSPQYVKGGIERVAIDPNLTRQLANASPLEQAAIYQDSDIWYDAVDILAQLWLDQPDNPDIEIAWETLLRSLDRNL